MNEFKCLKCGAVYQGTPPCRNCGEMLFKAASAADIIEAQAQGIAADMGFNDIFKGKV